MLSRAPGKTSIRYLESDSQDADRAARYGSRLSALTSKGIGTSTESGIWYREIRRIIDFIQREIYPKRQIPVNVLVPIVPDGKELQRLFFLRVLLSLRSALFALAGIIPVGKQQGVSFDYILFAGILHGIVRNDPYTVVVVVKGIQNPKRQAIPVRRHIFQKAWCALLFWMDRIIRKCVCERKSKDELDFSSVLSGVIGQVLDLGGLRKQQQININGIQIRALCGPENRPLRR